MISYSGNDKKCIFVGCESNKDIGDFCFCHCTCIEIEYLELEPSLSLLGCCESPSTTNPLLEAPESNPRPPLGDVTNNEKRPATNPKKHPASSAASTEAPSKQPAADPVFIREASHHAREIGECCLFV
jgi:hypothetical protein